MERKKLLLFLVLASLVVFTAAPLVGGCAKAPAPAPTPAPAPAPAPAPGGGEYPPYIGPKPPSSGKTATLTVNFESASGMRSYSVWPYRPGGILHQLVTELSGGRLKLDIKDKLYGVMDSVFAVGDGRVDMGGTLVPPINATYPLLDFGGLPGFFGGGVKAGYEWTYALLDPRMREILDSYTREAGFLIVAGISAESAHAFWGNKKIEKLSDFQGAKIRTGGLAQTLAVKAVGGSPLTISFQEIEEALSRGTVDLILTNLNYGQQRGLEDLSKYVSQWPNFGIIFARLILVNAKAYDALPPDLQWALMEAGRLSTLGGAMVIEQIARDYPAFIKDKGKTELIYAPESEVAKAAALMDEPIKQWIEKMGPLAPQVIKIAAEYATGPARDKTLSFIK